MKKSRQKLFRNFINSSTEYNFNKLFVEIIDDLLANCKKFHNSDYLVYDTVISVLLNFKQNPKKCSIDKNPYSWLITIIRNKIIDEKRKDRSIKYDFIEDIDGDYIIENEGFIDYESKLDVNYNTMLYNRVVKYKDSNLIYDKYVTNKSYNDLSSKYNLSEKYLRKKIHILKKNILKDIKSTDVYKNSSYV